MTKAVVLSSGGMDSTTLLWDKTRELGADHILSLSFNYGQRHRKELLYAEEIAARLGVRHETIDLQSLNPLLKGSALSDPDVEVPDGHYADDVMVQTIVPNRNAIMLNIAVGVTIGQGFDLVYAAQHAGDFAVYPDCRPEFFRSLNQTIGLATESNVRVVTPFVNLTKAEIAVIGGTIGVPYELTWTCYKGGEKHCGECGTCTERIEAFRVSGVKDPTEYENTEAYEALLAAGRVEA